MKIYIASKTKHAPWWRLLRALGCPISSTWIDEALPSESSDLSDLWNRCIEEASAADTLIIYHEKDEILKGAWVELGAALAIGISVHAVGISEYTIAHHPRIRHFPTLADALVATGWTVK